MSDCLLRPFTGTGSIFFPIGLPPDGTCEFSTKECRKYCYAYNDSLFDFESHIPEKEKQRIYDYIIKWYFVKTVCDRIVEELEGLQSPILHWFGTGDCMEKDTDRISSIIESMPDHVVQMGFTRNTKLWERHKDIFVLTIENREDIGDRDGMFSVSNFAEGISVMATKDYNVRGGYCGPITCRDLIESKLEHQINCQICHKLKIGCFDRRV